MLTLLTTAQRRKLAETYRKIEVIKECIGYTVQVGDDENGHRGEQGELIGWKLSETGEPLYVIRFVNGECIYISEEKFKEKGYAFIG